MKQTRSKTISRHGAAGPDTAAGGGSAAHTPDQPWPPSPSGPDLPLSFFLSFCFSFAPPPASQRLQQRSGAHARMRAWRMWVNVVGQSGAGPGTGHGGARSRLTLSPALMKIINSWSCAGRTSNLAAQPLHCPTNTG